MNIEQAFFWCVIALIAISIVCMMHYASCMIRRKKYWVDFDDALICNEDCASCDFCRACKEGEAHG